MYRCSLTQPDSRQQKSGYVRLVQMQVSRCHSSSCTQNQRIKETNILLLIINGWHCFVYSTLQGFCQGQLSIIVQQCLLVYNVNLETVVQMQLHTKLNYTRRKQPGNTNWMLGICASCFIGRLSIVNMWFT